VINYLRIGFSKVLQQKNVLNNLLWLFFDKFIRLAVGVIVIAWLARYLGPTQFGLLNFSIAVYFIFISIPKVGLDKILVRELVAKNKITSIILGSAFRIRFIIGLITALFTILIAHFSTSDDLKFYSIALISIAFLFPSFEVIDLFFQSLIKSRYSVIAQNLALAIASLVRVFFIIYEFSLLYFIGAFVLELVLYSCFLLIFYFKYNKELIFFKWQPKVGFFLLKSGVPLILTGLMTEIYMRVDQIMLEALSTRLELGYYSASFKLSQLSYFIPVAIGNSIFPKLITLRKSNHQRYLKYFKLYFLGLFLISTSIALSFTMFSNEIILLVFGEKYIFSSDILKFHIWSSIFIYLGVGTIQFLIIENLTRIILYRTITAAFINILLNYFLIQNFGGLGAAYATLISQGLMIVVTIVSPSFLSKLINRN
jgi:PST family polysaccharide transporter